MIFETPKVTVVGVSVYVCVCVCVCVRACVHAVEPLYSGHCWRRHFILS